MAFDEFRLISKNSAADRQLDLLMWLALSGVICALEHKGRIGHNDKLQMRRSEMGDTPECLVLRPLCM